MPKQKQKAKKPPVPVTPAKQAVNPPVFQTPDGSVNSEEKTSNSPIMEGIIDTTVKHVFDVHPADMYKYTKSLPQYCGATRQSWVDFKTKLKAIMSNLGNSSSTWTDQS
ncbi:MAG TPA: hypothetical protein VGD65_00840, partial [Chryseosolibacter sp.]